MSACAASCASCLRFSERTSNGCCTPRSPAKPSAPAAASRGLISHDFSSDPVCPPANSAPTLMAFSPTRSASGNNAPSVPAAASLPISPEPVGSSLLAPPTIRPPNTANPADFAACVAATDTEAPSAIWRSYSFLAAGIPKNAALTNSASGIDRPPVNGAAATPAA